MTELGFQGFPSAPEGVGLLEHWQCVLDSAPQEFTSVWISDHFQFHGEPYLEGWTRLTYLATKYPRFLCGHLVLGQGYRNPGLLAKMAQTLQLVTEGRFVLGIGAGWLEEEYRAFGYDYPPAGERVDQLAEAIQVLRTVWTESPATFSGKHYRVEGVVSDPPDPPIPIMVGTNGPRALGVAARHADWWNWDGPWEPTYRVPYERLRAHCEAIGRDVGEIVLTAGATVNLPTDPSTFVASYEHDFYPGQTFPVLGPTAEDVRREVQQLVDVGVRHVQLALEDMPTYERFVEDVLPRLDL